MFKNWRVYLFTFPNYALRNDATKKMRKIGITSNLEGRGKGVPGERLVSYASNKISESHARCIEKAHKIHIQYGNHERLAPLFGGGQRNKITEFFLCDEVDFQEITESVKIASQAIDRNHAEDLKMLIKEQQQWAHYKWEFCKSYGFPHHSPPLEIAVL